MTACVRHLNTKFNADQTDPAQIISSGARQRFLQCHQVTSYFFVLVTDWKVSSCGKANNTKFDLDPKRGRYWISQRILSNSFQKTFHVHVMVISLTFHLLSSYFQEQFKIVRNFSFYKRTTCFEYLPCKIEKRHQGLLSFQSKVLQYKYKKKCVKMCSNLISVLFVFFARKE